MNEIIYIIQFTSFNEYPPSELTQIDDIINASYLYETVEENKEKILSESEFQAWYDKAGLRTDVRIDSIKKYQLIENQ